MERDANYALVGLISTVLLIALIVFIVWLARFAFNQSYDEYRVVFVGPVRGLSDGGEVHFNGIKVGEVKKIHLDPTDPALVDADVAVTSDIPIRKDSIATLEPQGITGVNYIQIAAGTASQPLLKDTVAPGQIPVIHSQKDVLSDLLAGGGNVMQRALEALNRVNRVLSDHNIKKLSATLDDVQAVTAELRQRKAIIADADHALQSADQAAQQIKALAKSGQGLVDSDGKHTMVKVADAATQIEGAAKDLREIMAKLKGPTSDFATNGLPQLTSAISSLQQATDNLNRLIGEVEQNPRGLIAKPAARQVEVKP
ncbi:MAG: MlaD family protein [Caulobacterales bacterium]